jgi:cytoskeleton protein RodZ
MSGQAIGTGFVPVDSVFSEDNSGVVLLTAGERLCEARVNAGITLDSAAARTRIRRDYLEALETMDSRGLPERAYVTGYLRTYAGFLGLKPEPILEQFRREVDTETGRAQPTAAAQRRDPIKLPRGVFGAIIILLSVASVVWWYAQQASGATSFDNLASPPDAAPEWAQAGFSQTASETSVDDIWSGLPIGQGVSTVGSFTIQAQAPSWLEVRDASGRILFSQQLQTGELYQGNERGLTVSASDAGAIQLVVNGESVGALGEAGVSVENMAIDVDPEVTETAELSATE